MEIYQCIFSIAIKCSDTAGKLAVLNGVNKDLYLMSIQRLRLMKLLGMLVRFLTAKVGFSFRVVPKASGVCIWLRRKSALTALLSELDVTPNNTLTVVGGFKDFDAMFKAGPSDTEPRMAFVHAMSMVIKLNHHDRFEDWLVWNKHGDNDGSAEILHNGELLRLEEFVTIEGLMVLKQLKRSHIVDMFHNVHNVAELCELPGSSTVVVISDSEDEAPPAKAKFDRPPATVHQGKEQENSAPIKKLNDLVERFETAMNAESERFPVHVNGSVAPRLTLRPTGTARPGPGSSYNFIETMLEVSIRSKTNTHTRFLSS